ncbi:N-acetyltransferase [Xanthomonas arboricola pv. juglandis]|uniref:hypothetical protein n=1 Tax=Xanthomonas euroxanthea TaxID=2259622 RepID=UPI000E867177|nr:hypothetical protein [Xanthomonas euroxanthea]SYZ57060.1 N-acetyltransferase [Xanthomonas arboricola pv. juglandis]
MHTTRTWNPDDFSACLALFDGNVPAIVGNEELPDFVRFLTHHAAAWHYQVIERAGEVIACAGKSINPYGTTASLFYNSDVFFTTCSSVTASLSPNLWPHNLLPSTPKISRFYIYLATPSTLPPSALD